MSAAGDKPKPLHPGHDVGVDYELVVSDTGTAMLTLGGEVIWWSDADDEFSEEFTDSEFIDVMDEEQTDAVIEWLVAKGYIPPDLDVDVMSEADRLEEP
jgi:hypothetical protein